MKKILIALTLLIALTTTAQAQLLYWGVRGGVGPSFHTDDIASEGAVLGANVGGFVTFGFTNGESFFAENFTLQTGLNFIRRGGTFEEVYEKGLLMSYREGTYNQYYLQLPLLATIRYELPIRQPGHRALISIGPAVSYGLFGTVRDRKISRGLPQTTWNYDVTNPVFGDDYLKRLDVDLIFGLGYEWKDLIFMVQLDYGFTSLRDEDDVLTHSTTTTEQTGDSQTTVIDKVPIGSNSSFLFTIGYQFPVR